MKTKKNWLAAIILFVCSFNVFSQTTQIKGLTVIVEFSDAPFVQSNDSVARMMNQPGFSGWGNEGSVRDYYYIQSNGKIEISSLVVRVSLPNTIAYYYAEETKKYFDSDVITRINQQNPNGFQNLTLNQAGNAIELFNIVSKAGKGGGSYETDQVISIKNNGVFIRINKITNTTYGLDQEPEHNTICHELGHAVMNWTDYYSTAWSNLGNYCLMGSGGSNAKPMPVCPALRLQNNWINNVIEVGNRTYDTTITAVSNSYSTIFKYTNPSNPKEFLLIHPVEYSGYYQQYMPANNIADHGLAIFYVDKEGGSDLPGSELNWLIKLVQADNKDEMHEEYLQNFHVRGDFDDMYDNIKNSFPNGTPFRWKNGGEFGLSITNISAPGATMTFTVKGRQNTVIASSDQNGTVSPAGVIGVNNGTAKTFTLTPNPGYEINTVKVNGSLVTATNNQYTFSSVSGTKKLEVTFKRKATPDAMPAPWQHTDIGYQSVSGSSGYTNGKFYLESSGVDIWGSSDAFRYVYQTLNGDGSIEAKLVSSNKPNGWSKVGLMIRESLEAGAAHSMLMFTPENFIREQHRAVTNDWMTDATNSIVNRDMNIYYMYKWFRITRTGNVITSYCSLDRTIWRQVAQHTIPMGTQVLVGMAATGANGEYASRAIFDSVTVSGNTALCAFTGTKITGTVIGTEGASSQNQTATRDKAFDNDLTTFFMHDDQVVWTGLSLSQNYKITGVKFAPRTRYEDHMISGKFQGSNIADFSTGVVDLATVYTKPGDGWNCISITNPASFRYIRYISSAGGYGIVSEIEFYGTKQNPNNAPTVTITSPAANSSFIYPATITINATAADSDGSIAKVEFYSGVNYLNKDTVAPYTFSISNLPSGTYSFTAKAYDNLGATSEYTISGITVSTNIPPTVTITSPASNTAFLAPAAINITANAADANGSVSKVEFFNGSTLLGTDATAPYSYNWTNVAAGTYNLTAKATDNAGAYTNSTAVTVLVTANTADITGPACANNNTTITYELAPSKRVNVTGYGWYFTGSTQTFAPSSVNPYQATLVTGNNYGAGQLCVGVSYGSAPYYTTYCITIPKCSGAREGSVEETETLVLQSVSFPNPFTSKTTINLTTATQDASIQVYNASGMIVEEATATGSFTFGENLSAGIYFVKISTGGKTETLKLVKE